MRKLLSLSLLTVSVLCVHLTAVGEKSFKACRNYALSMLECFNTLNPRSRVRVPIDLLMYPHMTLIGFKNPSSPLVYNCGGSLVSEKWVLTAAHCIEDPNAGPAMLLRVGTATFEFDESDDLVQMRSIAKTIQHPGYAPPSKYHDLALMMADSPFHINRDIRIVCLNLHDEVHINVTAIGFGTTMAGAAFGSQTLMKVDMDIIPNEICNRSMKALTKRGLLKYGIIPEQMCAGDYENGGKDTCQGDSGGPLQYMPRNVDCKTTFPLHVLVGVTSFGRDCGRKWAPGVYSRVSRYLEWIESIVWP